MNCKYKSALALIKEFCEADFVERDVDKSVSLLTDDIKWFGTVDNEDAHNKIQAAEYIKCEIAALPTPYKIEYLSESETPSGTNTSVAYLKIKISNAGVRVQCRVTAASRFENGQSKICSMHMSIANTSQQDDEYFPVSLAAEKSRQIKEDLLNSIIPGGMMGGYMEKDFPIYFINNKMLKYLGYQSEEEFVEDIGGLIINCIHPEDAEYVCKVVETQLCCAEEYVVEYRMRKKDGSYIWVYDAGRKITAENGKMAITSVCYDITDQKNINEQIEKVNQEITQLYNFIPGAVFSCRFDADWTVTFANDGLFRFLGYTRDEFKGLFANKMSGVIYPADGAVMVEKISRQLEYGSKIKNENRLICKDGSIKWISLHAELMLDENAEQYFYCIFVDITEQKKAEMELNNTQQKLEAAINHAGLAYCEYDIANDRAYFNSIATREYGIAAVIENYPQSLYDAGAIHKDSLAACNKMIQRVKAGQSNTSADVQIINANGDKVWKRIRFTILYDEDKKPFWGVSTSESIEDYKRLEEQLSLVAAQTGMEVWTYDFFNKTMTRIARSNVNDERLQVVADLSESIIGIGAVHPKDGTVLLEMEKKMLAGQRRVSGEIRLYNADIHDWVYYKIDHTVIFDKQGNPERAIGTGVDISERKKMEQRYEQELTFKEGFNDERTVAAILVNLNKGKIERLIKNTLYADKLTGITDYVTALGEAGNGLLESQKASFEKLFHIDNLRSAAVDGQNQVEYEYVKKMPDGTMGYFLTRVKLVKNPYTGEYMGLLSTKDITTETLYKKIVNSVVENFYDFIVDIDINKDSYTIISFKKNLVNMPPITGKFSQVNAEYSQMFADEKSTKDYIEKLSYSYMLERLAADTAYSFNYRIKENGKICTKKIQPFYVDKIVGHIGFTCIDVTNLLEQEHHKNEALVHALISSERSSKAKTAFLSRMSHDIRTPMNAIIGMTALTKHIIPNDTKVMENLLVIESSAKHLLGIINDILDMSQIESGNMTLVRERFDLLAEYHNVAEMAQVLFDSKQQEFVVEHNFRHRYFIGDIVRLKRVVINLLNNAAKFTPKGGKIKLTAQEKPANNPKIAMLMFSVEDTGRGISQAEMKHIFEPFYQTDTPLKSEGSGLGLSIVKSIVETKGGTINVQSEVGKGSTFTIVLPVAIDQENKDVSPQISDDNKVADFDFSNLKVLLIEDHPVNILVAQRLLEQYGGQVDIAENGAVGYDKFVSSEAGKYNVIFMDIQMPVMNGYEATRSIRQSSHPDSKSIPIIAMTANAYAEDIKKSIDSGMNEHIAKPISVEVIAKVVNGLMKEGQMV